MFTDLQQFDDMQNVSREETGDEWQLMYRPGSGAEISRGSETK